MDENKVLLVDIYKNDPTLLDMLEPGQKPYIERFTDLGIEVVKELLRKGHNIQTTIGGYGGYQAIMKDHQKGVYFGASESRKDGQAAGY